jgi:hypothetical protein
MATKMNKSSVNVKQYGIIFYQKVLKLKERNYSSAIFLSVSIEKPLLSDFHAPLNSKKFKKKFSLTKIL